MSPVDSSKLVTVEAFAVPALGRTKKNRIYFIRLQSYPALHVAGLDNVYPRMSKRHSKRLSMDEALHRNWCTGKTPLRYLLAFAPDGYVHNEDK